MIFDDLLDARILVEVGARLSFAGAARSLGIPPATLSRRVARMEEHAGVRLFERTTRKVGVTPAGRLAIAHAERIGQEAAAVEASIEAMRDAPMGPVRVTAPVILGQALLPPVAGAFVARYPACELRVDLINRRVDLVEEQVDLAIRVGSPGAADLVARRLGAVEAGLFAAPAKGRAIASPDDLVGAAVGWLGNDDRAPAEIVLEDPAGTRRRIDVSPRIRTNDPWLLRDAGASSGLVVVLPRMIVVDDLRCGRLEPVLPAWSIHRQDVFAVMPSRRLMRPAVRVFLDLVVEMLSPQLG
ncbi:MAG: LysR substrate-binding domain-containing protein [Myxococcota bacterium]